MAAKQEIYRIPDGSGGMRIIAGRRVFTGGAGYYKVEQRGEGDWIVVC